MGYEGKAAIARNWQEAANERDVARLLELSEPDIKIIGPLGSVRGRDALEGWLSRAGLRLETLRTFTREDAVVMFQHGVWKSPETGDTTEEADLATRFLIEGGHVSELARYDGDDALNLALEDARLSYEHEV